MIANKKKYNKKKNIYIFHRYKEKGRRNKKSEKKNTHFESIFKSLNHFIATSIL